MIFRPHLDEPVEKNQNGRSHVHGLPKEQILQRAFLWEPERKEEVSWISGTWHCANPVITSSE